MANLQQKNIHLIDIEGIGMCSEHQEELSQWTSLLLHLKDGMSLKRNI
jgi:hypothetical protein